VPITDLGKTAAQTSTQLAREELSVIDALQESIELLEKVHDTAADVADSPTREAAEFLVMTLSEVKRRWGDCTLALDKLREVAEPFGADVM